jgi:flagellar biosynthesis/type III secretory pathway M-ring protein FliF/YscJ
MTSINQIACIDMGNGLYLNCSSKNFTTIIPSEKGYDNVKEVVIDNTNIGGDVDSSFQNPFEELFKSNIKDIITIVVIIISVIVAAAILFFILKFLYMNFKRDKERNIVESCQMTQFPTNASSSVRVIPGGGSSASSQDY